MGANKVILKKAQKIKPPKRPIPWAFKLFFAIAFVIIGGAALRYVEEQHYINQLQIYADDKQKMQEALGWGSELKIDKKSEPLAKIRFMLRDQNHKPIQGAIVNITLSHASDVNGVLSQNSMNLPLTMVEPGVYRGQINLPLPGEWDASINAQIGQNSYQVNERLILP